MKETILLNKEPFLHGKLLSRLLELRDRAGLDEDKFIPWAHVYQNICRLFTLKKEECRYILYSLKTRGLLTVSPRGIRLNYEVSYNV